MERRDFMASLFMGALPGQVEEGLLHPDIRAALLAGRAIVFEMGKPEISDGKKIMTFALHIRAARDDEDFTDWEPKEIARYTGGKE